MTHDPIDTAVFRALQESTDAAFVAELLASFQEDAPLALAALRTAAATRDAVAFRRQAHTLKANAVTFGAAPMGEAARLLEETSLAELDAQGDTPRGSSNWRRPLLRPPGACRSSAMRERRSPAGRVLLVEDNRVNRLLLERHVEQLGHRVETVEDGHAALRSLREERFDLMLLDIDLPGLDGFEVLETLRREPLNAEVPVIVTSALEGVDKVVRCVELGAEDYLHKPVNLVLLRARMNASLERKRLRDEQRELVRRFATSEPSHRTWKPRAFPWAGACVLGQRALFCDIRGFTGLVESQPPEAVIELLNSYYTLMFDGHQWPWGRRQPDDWRRPDGGVWCPPGAGSAEPACAVVRGCP